jgi:hypothetical protein
MTDELKPCPICGGEAQLEDYRDGGGIGFAVHCQTFTCQTCGPADLGVSGAIEQWNTRPIEDELLAALEQLTLILRVKMYGLQDWMPDPMPDDEALEMAFAAIAKAKPQPTEDAG